MQPNDALDEAIKDQEAIHGQATLVGILSYLASDTSNYEEETGDCEGFGMWACLFEFNENERARIANATGDTLTNGFVSYFVDDAGFKTVGDRDDFDRFAVQVEVRDDEDEAMTRKEGVASILFDFEREDGRVLTEDEANELAQRITDYLEGEN